MRKTNTDDAKLSPIKGWLSCVVGAMRALALSILGNLMTPVVSGYLPWLKPLIDWSYSPDAVFFILLFVWFGLSRAVTGTQPGTTPSPKTATSNGRITRPFDHQPNDRPALVDRCTRGRMRRQRT